jgi:hypothetical protein
MIEGRKNVLRVTNKFPGIYIQMSVGKCIILHIQTKGIKWTAENQEAMVILEQL